MTHFIDTISIISLSVLAASLKARHGGAIVGKLEENDERDIHSNG
jgi:hypothetical protein